MKWFLDLGSNRGKILREFVASPEYEDGMNLHAFEANPLIDEKIIRSYPAGTIVHRKAVWIHDGTVDFYVNPNGEKMESSSVIREKKTGGLDFHHPLHIPCVDFSAWLKSNISPGDNVICKCDIEGAEYEVFKKLCSEGTISLLSLVYMERHWSKIGMSKSDDEAFCRKLRCHGLKLRGEYKKVA